MKVLYIGSERSDAQSVATALRNIDEVVSVLWASQLEHAARWLDETRDLSALVIEAPIEGASCAAVLTHVRCMTQPPAVVLIVPDGVGPSLDSLPAWADSIRRDQSLQRDLPIVVTRAIGRAARVDIAQKLEHATTALQQAEQRYRTAADQLAGLEAQYEIGVARAAASWDMVDEQLRTAAMEVERARQNQDAAVTEVNRLSRRDAELSAQLAEASAARGALERRLADAEADIESANARTEHERLAAAEQLADRQRDFQTQIAREIDQRRDVEQRLASAMTDAETRSRQLEEALSQVRQEMQSRTADIERLTTRETELTSRLEEISASRQDLERRLAATRAAFEEAGTRATRDRLSASKKAAEREAELDGRLQQERTTRAALEEGIAEAEAALRDAQERHEAARAAASTEISELHAARETIQHQLDEAQRAMREAAARETALSAQRDQERTTRAALEQALIEAEAASRDAQQRHDAALAAAASDLAARQAHFDRELSATAADRDRLTQRLSETTTELDEVRRNYDSSAADVERLTRLQADLASQLVGLEATRRTLEVAIADGATTLREAQQRHDAALAAAAADLAERQAHFDRELTTTGDDRDRLALRLSDTITDLDEVRRTYESSAADVERLTHLHAGLTSQLAELQAARDTLEHQLADATKALHEAAARETELDALLQQECTARGTLEQAMADAETARRDTEAQHQAALTAAAAELADRQAYFARELSVIADDRDGLAQRLKTTSTDLEDVCRAYESATIDIEGLTRREADLTSQLAARQADFDRALSETVDDRDRLAQRLSESDIALEQLRRQHRSTLADVELLMDRATDLVAQLADVQGANDTLERQLADATGAIRDAAALQRSLEEQIEQERASRAFLERVLDDTRSTAFEKEEQLGIKLAQEQLEHESRLAGVEESRRTLELERDTLQRSLATLREESQRLRQTLTANVEQLDASRTENHRLFDLAGVAMFRCTPDGALTDINRACVTLIGRRTLDEPRGIEFAAAVFEDPNALSWLIERCLTKRTKESVETTWRRQDGTRLFMRLSARSCAGNTVEIVAEDLTRLRVLEERLARAQRMEAVGRLAVEVAVTCSALLNGIQQKGREWLTSAGDADSRREGKQLFDDVGRAAGFLQELAACGDEQARTPTLVDLNILVRDLEPVLRRVAGDDVEVQLRDTSSPLNVEVGTERVERLLVNLASYGRGRMPSGGRLRIELGTSVVDRRFAARHPNVRLGLHALITVTETGNAPGSDEARGRAAGRPALDFGTLQGLVSECGGHLWMNVQPPGEMVAKIRLPLSIADDRALPRANARVGRARTPARWFQS